MDLQSVNSRLRKNCGWVITFSSFLMNFFGFGIMYCFSITFLSIQKEFGTRSSLTAWVGSIPIGLSTASGVLVTPLILRFHNRPVAIVGIFFCFSSCLATSFLTTFMPIYFTYSALYGIGVGFSSLASMDLLLRYFPNKNCARATLLSLVGSSGGVVLLGPLTFYLIENWGWRNMLRFMGSLLLVIGLPATMTFSQPSSREKSRADDKSIVSILEKCHSRGNRESLNVAKRTDKTFTNEAFSEDEADLAEGASNGSTSHVKSNNRPENKSTMNFSRYHSVNHVRECATEDNRLVNEIVIHTERSIASEIDCKSRRDSTSGENASVCWIHYQPTFAGQSLNNKNSHCVDSVNEDDSECSNEVSLDDCESRASYPNERKEIKSRTITSIAHGISSEEARGHASVINANEGDVTLSRGAKSTVNNNRTGFISYRAFLYPDLIFISICVAGLTVMNTFFYVNFGDFLLSVSFERHVIPWVVATLGISEVVGKVLLAVVADRLPFPKIFLYHIACLVGVVVMCGFLVVRSVVILILLAVATGMCVMTIADALAYSICTQIYRSDDVVQTWTVVMVTQGLGYMLGSLFGESIDRSGSYEIAIYSSIAAYVICSLFSTAVPLYQKAFAPSRFIMFEHQRECRRKRCMSRRQSRILTCDTLPTDL